MYDMVNGPMAQVWPTALKASHGPILTIVGQENKKVQKIFDNRAQEPINLKDSAPCNVQSQ